MKKEKKRNYPINKRCPRCVRHTPGKGHTKDYHPAMARMYIRICSKSNRDALCQVGWFCRDCGKMMRLRKMDVETDDKKVRVI